MCLCVDPFQNLLQEAKLGQVVLKESAQLGRLFRAPGYGGIQKLYSQFLLMGLMMITGASQRVEDGGRSDPVHVSCSAFDGFFL